MAECSYTPCDKGATHTVEIDGEDRQFCHTHALEARTFSSQAMPTKIA